MTSDASVGTLELYKQQLQCLYHNVHFSAIDNDLKVVKPKHPSTAEWTPW